MATNKIVENGSTDASAINSNPQSSTLDSVAAAEPDSTEAGGAESDLDPSNSDYLSAPASDSGAQEASNHTGSSDKKWPGWPGDCVFRLIVPVVKVGSIIGRKGDLIKKMCEETKARIRVLDGAVGTPDRVVSVFLSQALVFSRGMACYWNFILLFFFFALFGSIARVCLENIFLVIVIAPALPFLFVSRWIIRLDVTLPRQEISPFSCHGVSRK